MPRNHLYAQHFLRSPRLVAELIGHSNVRKNDTVLDLGAGSGVITSSLARRARQVIAVENEPGSLQKLRANCGKLPNVKIVNEDILAYSSSVEKYKIFANIPFNISAKVVEKFAFTPKPPSSVYLIVQKQFAQKIIASDRHFTSSLGAKISPWWQAKIKKPLRKTDFTPPPAVDTVLLETKPRETALLPTAQTAEFCAFVDRCFREQQFYASVKKGDKKPSELSPEAWVALFQRT